MAKRFSLKNAQFINREISWLSFNARVLQEAEDPTVPLLERVKFMGIFSNNLDEFFRVRFATIRRMAKYGVKNEKSVLDGTPEEILERIRVIALEQRKRFDKVFNQLVKELADEKIFLVNENQLDEEQGQYVRNYFRREVRTILKPIMIDSIPEMPILKDSRIYLAVKLARDNDSSKSRFSLIKVPTTLPRFLELPAKGDKNYVIMLDDVIRYNLDDIFYQFKYDSVGAYTIKLTRDAELDIDNDVSKSLIELVSRSIKQRQVANPVRFIHDMEMPEDLLTFLKQRLHLRGDDNTVSGGRYHAHRDFMKFPGFGRTDLKYQKPAPLPHKALAHSRSVLSSMKKGDILVHYPYQTFQHMIHMLQEAALDPKVKSIKMTIYRVAENSAVANALINAVRNGKDVTVVVELFARFDEESNIFWARKLHEEGVHIIEGVPGLKVHSKLCLITREEKGGLKKYATLATGNFNEDTAKLYTDKALFTANDKITREVEKLFKFFANNLRRFRYRHLVISPFSLRNKMVRLINKEIANAEAGKEAYILLKMNSLTDADMICKLYDASQAGVKIRLIVRGICCLVPGVKGMSENIQAMSIVDKYLEHTRLSIFCNGGDPMYHISSADWMTRNLDHRIEVSCPIYDKELQQELRDIFEIQWSDNVKGRSLKGEQKNEYIPKKGKKAVRAQEAIYEHVKTLQSGEAEEG